MSLPESYDRCDQEIYADNENQENAHILDRSEVFPGIKELEEVLRNDDNDNDIENMNNGEDERIEHPLHEREISVEDL